MTNFQKKIAWGTVIASCILFGLVMYFWPRDQQSLGHGGPLETADTFLIGTVSSGTTLSTSYGTVSSTRVYIGSQPNVAFFVGYKPRTFGSNLYLLLERSPDSGVSWYPYNVIQPTATSTLVFSQGASSTAGIPFVYPGSGQLTANVTSTFSFDVTLAAGLFRISAKEDTTSTAGILYLQSYSSSI